MVKVKVVLEMVTIELVKKKCRHTMICIIVYTMKKI
nr:MAG TPA: hypothetical protein [Bacteriophage sp.]